ncbi:MAG: C25 family peptidase propeptide domain-containing protein [Dehalococcoidia bacterium]|nr:C25 family peptidase propeptide domain-containing protein [Dehalococcoidia bacterium]MDD5493138.1 C25 family peptidase propeptide domain-containing protein [Dehalococcoidia bacterium]
MRQTGLSIAVIILAISSFILPSNADVSYAASGSGSIILSLPSGTYTISKDQDGADVIRMDGFYPMASPGDPMLPHKVFDVIVPPDVVWQSISLRIVSAEKITLEGTYDIKPTPPMAIADNISGGQPNLVWGSGKQIVDNKNVAVYGNDADFPAVYLNILPYSQMRKWNFTRVDFIPFQYNPVSKKLTLIKSATVEISYQQSGIQPSAAMLSDRVMDSAAPQVLFNYGQSSASYVPSAYVQPQATYNYVIITTSAIQAGSAKLASFVTHKQNKGYSVLVVTEAQWGAVTGQSPNHKAEKIRKWLQDNYISYGIQNVLLIGNPTPYESGEGDVPMKMCWPRRGYGSYEDAPTDHFYADLTGNWDLNGNQYYGEASGDTGSGGVDLAAEVFVGRIPVYNADYTTLDNILQKTIDYENEGSSGWRKSALLPMSFSDVYTDGAYLSEQMRTNYLTGGGYSSWRMYQQGSACPAANSSFASEEELRSGTYVRDRWAASDYGIVCWWGHGNETGAYAGYGSCDNGAFFTSSSCSSLDDDHPSFTYQCSCTNGYPESSSNLQYAILKQGGIGTVGASRVSWYYIGQTNFVGSPSNSGIGYEYVKRLVANNAAGNALYSTIQSVIPVSDAEFLQNAFGFNLYGDPSVTITPTNSPPTVTNATGATNITNTTATLNGNLTSNGGLDTTVTIYWGDNDGGTTAGNWDNPVNLGVRSVGAFSTDLTGLTTNTTYYYRCSATNAQGTVWSSSTEQFVAITQARLVGTDSNTYGYAAGGNYIHLTRFVALGSGTVNQMRVNAGVAGGSVKLAIYADAGGQPGALLNALNTATPCASTGWNTINFPATAVTAGTAYWLAENSNVATCNYKSDAAYQLRFTAYSFDSSFPSTLSGLYSMTGYIGIAGWGAPAEPPPPPTPPTVSTGVATSVSSRTAVLNGNMTVVGSVTPVSVYFQYGTTVSYGSATVQQQVSATGAFNASASGLTPATLYHFRSVAVPEGGSAVYGSDATFTTLAATLGVSTAAATTVTSAGAVLNGILDDLGSNPSADVYFQYGTTTSYGSSTAPQTRTETGSFSQSISGLTASTPYHYRAVAEGSTTVYGTDVMFNTTSAEPQRLVGTDSNTYGYAAGGNYIHLTRFVALGSGTVNQMRVNAGVAGGSVKLAIYADAGGQPGALLNALNTATPCASTGWNTINFPATAVTAGTAYWLAENSNVATCNYKSDASYQLRYLPLSFGSSFPSSLSVLYSMTGYIGIAGWGAPAEPPPPPTPPTVSTGVATSVSSRTAVLNGNMTVVGSVTPVSVYFQYGTTVSYGSATVQQQVSATGAFNASASGLTPATLYHFRSVAVPEGGSAVYGSDATFTTLAATLGVSTAAATTVTSAGAVLNGILDDLGSNPSADVYFQYGTTTSYGSSTAPQTRTETGSFSQSISGLTASTPYHYRAVAEGSTTVYGTDVMFNTTSAEPQRLVGTDSNTYGYAAGGNYIHLTRFVALGSGTVNQMRVNAGVAGGSVKLAIYADAGGQPGALLNALNTATPCASTGWNTINFPATAVTAGTAYWLAENSNVATCNYKSDASYQLRYLPLSFGSSFPSSLSELYSMTGYIGIAGWGSSEPTLASVTNGSGASAITSSTATLNGNLVVNDSFPVTVHIYWGDNDGGTTIDNWDQDENLGVLGSGAFSKNISGLNGSTTYYYRCSAINAAGQAWANSNASFITAVPPLPPGAPSLLSPGARIVVKWSKTSGATNYGLQVNTASDFGAGTMAFNNTSLGDVDEYEVTGLSFGTTYYWRVNASNAAGTSPWSQVWRVAVYNSP